VFSQKIITPLAAKLNYQTAMCTCSGQKSSHPPPAAPGGKSVVKLEVVEVPAPRPIATPMMGSGETPVPSPDKKKPCIRAEPAVDEGRCEPTQPTPMDTESEVVSPNAPTIPGEPKGCEQEEGSYPATCPDQQTTLE